MIVHLEASILAFSLRACVHEAKRGIAQHYSLCSMKTVLRQGQSELVFLTIRILRGVVAPG